MSYSSTSSFIALIASTSINIQSILRIIFIIFGIISPSIGSSPDALGLVLDDDCLAYFPLILLFVEDFAGFRLI